VSADNWAVCPRCEKLRQEGLAAERATLDLAYGTVPLVVFDAMRAELEAKLAEHPQRTFREDYEFYGIDEGTLGVSYRGSCKTCGLSFTLSQEHDVLDSAQ